VEGMHGVKQGVKQKGSIEYSMCPILPIGIHTYARLQRTIYGDLVIYKRASSWSERILIFAPKSVCPEARFAHSHPSQKLTTKNPGVEISSHYVKYDRISCEDQRERPKCNIA